MASNPNSLISKLLPTNHRLILNKILTREFKGVSGEVLVCGAGHNPHKKFGAIESVSTLDLDDSLDVDYVADIHALPFPNSVFDSVVVIEVLEHCKNPDTALAECRRVLKPGGLLIVSTPFMFHLHADPFDFFRFSRSYFMDRLEVFGSLKVIAFGNLIHVLLDSLSSSYAIFRIIRPISYITSKIFPYTESEKFPSGYVVVFRNRAEK